MNVFQIGLVSRYYLEPRDVYTEKFSDLQLLPLSEENSFSLAVSDLIPSVTREETRSMIPNINEEQMKKAIRTAVLRRSARIKQQRDNLVKTAIPLGCVSSCPGWSTRRLRNGNVINTYFNCGCEVLKPGSEASVTSAEESVRSQTKGTSSSNQPTSPAKKLEIHPPSKADSESYKMPLPIKYSQLGFLQSALDEALNDMSRK